MIEITSDLKDMIICALRYSLGRKTYTTYATSEYIIEHPELIDKRVKQVMLNDLKEYFNMKENCYSIDDDCDYENWKRLFNWLEKIDVSDEQK